MEKETKVGKLTWPSGKTYDGEYKDNQPHGKGIMTFSGGEVYEGEFKDGKANGNGKMIFASGNVYEGSWKDNKRHGRGRYVWNSDDSTKDSVTYERNAQVTGVKSKRSKKGNWYFGDWENDKPAGRGEFFFAHLDGATYSGEVSNWEPNGIGKMHWPSGSEYLGEMTSGAINGNGLYISGKTGVIYDGSWKNDVRDGYLVMKDCTMKIIYAGNWENNRMLDADKVEDVVFLDGSKYSGGWVGNAPHGYGVMTKPDGTIQKGEWKEGLLAKACDDTKEAAASTNQIADIDNPFSDAYISTQTESNTRAQLEALESMRDEAERVGKETAKEMVADLNAALKRADAESFKKHRVNRYDERGIVKEYYSTDSATGKRIHVIEYYYQGDYIIHQIFDPDDND